MVGQSSGNRLATFSFWRDFASTSYVFSLIALFGFGIGMEKPAATNSALAMSLCSLTRFATQRVSERPLNRTIANLQAENYQANTKSVALEEALRENYGWYEKYKRLEHDREVSQNQVRELEQSCESIRAKWEEAEKFNQEWQVEQAKWEVRLTEYKKPMQAEIDRLKDVCKRLQQDYRNSVDELNVAIERNNELSAQLEYARLQIQSLLAPKKLAEGLDTNNLANQLVEWFQKADPAIVLDAESADVRDGNWILVFILRNKRDGNRAKELATAMMNDFSLPVVPSLKVNDDRLTITVFRGEQSSESKYLKVDPIWLKNALVFSKSGRIVTHHARFSGSTETGKSTLVSNAVGCIIHNIPLIEVILADPLTAGMSEWKTLTPIYKGEDACVAGLLAFYDEFKRLDQGEEKSDKPKVFILDEFDRMMNNHPELMPIVLDLWKSGRHQQRYLWVIGQSVLVGKFKLNMEDVQNVVGFYLGNTVDRGLSDANDSPEYNVRLREEWHYAKARGLRYVCLCRPMTITGRPFLAVMPKPGEYATGKMQAHSIAEQAQAESQMDGRLIEFDLESTRESLNRLLDSSSEVQPDLTAGLTKVELGKVKRLLSQGLSVAKIINQVWNLKPSGKDEYKNRKKQVEFIKNQG